MKLGNMEKTNTAQRYKAWRICIFISIYVVYFMIYVNRKVFGATMHDIQAVTGLSNADIGFICCVFYISYGVGKFVNGTISDRVNLKFWLPGCLLISSGLGVAMAVCVGQSPAKGNMLAPMALIWGLNGWFQSFAFPLCAKALTFWFCNRERSKIWSFWGTSYELGTATAGFVLLPFIERFGWEFGFYFPAVVSVFVGVLAFFSLQDNPKAVGLPEVEGFFGTKPEPEPEQTQEEKRSYFEILKEDVLCNRELWLLAIALFFVNVVRCGSTDWMLKFFKEIGDTRAMATAKAATIPVFGIVGMLTIPVVSERVFGGRRAPANFWYLGMASASLFCMIKVLGYGPGILAPVKEAVLFICLALLGSGVCGALTMLSGVCSIELASKRVAAAAVGFTGAAGYAGAAVSSYVTGYLKDAAWAKNCGIMLPEFWFWGGSALVAMLVCLALWKKQR